MANSEEPQVDSGYFVTDEAKNMIQNEDGLFLFFQNGNLSWVNLISNESSSSSNTEGGKKSNDSSLPSNTEGEKKRKAEDIKAANSSASTKKKSMQWTRSQTLALIAFYESNKELFTKSTTKHDKIWQEFELAQQTEDESPTLQQIKDKWAALKKKFFAKLDNMSGKSSGSAPVHFEYFDEMYDIFRDDPRANPVAVASSSRGAKNVSSKKPVKNVNQSVSDDDSDGASDIKEVKSIPKPKKTKLEAHLEALKADREKREENVQLRHTQQLELQANCLNVLKDMSNIMKELISRKRKREERSSDDSNG